MLGNTATTVKGVPRCSSALLLAYSCCSDRLAPAGSRPHTDRSSGAEIGAQSPAAGRTMHGHMGHAAMALLLLLLLLLIVVPWDPSGSPHLACRWMVHRRPSLWVSLTHAGRGGKKDGGFTPLRAEGRGKHDAPFPLPRVGNGEKREREAVYMVALGLAC